MAEMKTRIARLELSLEEHAVSARGNDAQVKDLEKEIR